MLRCLALVLVCALSTSGQSISGGLAGFVSYSYMFGSAFLPVTGGLFLGDDAADTLSDERGRFWISQGQRHTVRTRLRYQIVSRVWVAGGAEYCSGLPLEFEGIQ